ncbi:hypothetical protein [Streptomyces sp. NPDC050535]|uniref:hypothetical protein n=1 Tax=Streptomyces sp. NPDC050535 TaxID=3365626 RepID=UPI00379B98B4
MLGPIRQAVLVLRWIRERGRVYCLAQGAGVSQATGYRYLHEGASASSQTKPPTCTRCWTVLAPRA